VEQEWTESAGRVENAAVVSGENGSGEGKKHRLKMSVNAGSIV